jgi:hypothetical protein
LNYLAESAFSFVSLTLSFIASSVRLPFALAESLAWVTALSLLCIRLLAGMLVLSSLTQAAKLKIIATTKTFFSTFALL